MGITKKIAQKIHSKTRALERYGVKLTNKDLWKIGRKIRDGDSKLVEKLTTSRSLHEVEYNSHLFLVCYDKVRHNICSFLPKGE